MIMKKLVKIKKYGVVLILVFASMFGQLKLFAKKTNHIDAVILIEKGGEDGGQEAENARLKDKGIAGPVTYDFFKALEQEASIVIASAPVVRNLFLTRYIGRYQLDSMSHKPSIKEFLGKWGELGDKLEKKPDNEELKKQLAKLKQDLEEKILSDEEWAEENKETLSVRKLLKNLIDEKKWSIYQADNKYVIFIPESKYPQRSLGDLGLSAKLKKVAGANLEKTFENSTDIPIDVGVLNNVFADDFSVKKRIYLIGHGYYSKDLLKDVETGQVSLNPGATALVGQLKYDQYVELIERLDKIGCEFFAVSSCFAGGWNLLTFHSKLQKGLEKDVFSRISVSYPIAILALSNVARQVKGVNFRTFFERLDEFFTRRGHTISHWIHKPFGAILEPISGQELENSPSIKFPGIRTFFRPVDVDDKVQVLSYPSLIKHELIHKVKKGPKDLRLKNKEALLIYPSIIDVPLTFLGTKYLPLISMIPGPAHHYLQSITAAKINVMGGFFSGFGIWGLQPKAFFIGKLNYGYAFKKDKVALKNVLISSRMDLLTNEYSLEVIAQREDNKKYYVKTRTSEWTEISKEQAYKKIRQILKETTPAKEALTEATGGIESERQFTKKIDALLK